MSIEKLIDLSRNANVAEDLTDEQLDKIGRDVVRLTESDDASRDAWKKRSEDAMKLALQVVEEKSFPWPNASNVKYPTVTVSAMAFHARTLPAILSGNKIAKAKVTGKDEDGEKEKQAQRVADYLNYQILHEMDGWEDDMDRLLLALPIEGCEFKKTYFSPDKGTNVSEWIRPADLIVHDKTKCFDDCPRATHRFWMHPQYIDERQRMGIWTDAELNISKTDADEEVLQEFYEQHTLLDLDGDGFKEPWCVTVHKDSSKVVRIKADFAADDIAVRIGKGKVMPIEEMPADARNAKVAKIERIQYFTKYTFIPSPDGSFYDIGLGQIVGPINDSISSILNQIIDAGTYANLAANSGFVADGVSVNRQRGPIKVKMGEYKSVKLPAGMPSIQNAIMSLPAGGPSAVLFNTLGMLIGAAKDIAGVQDIHTGGTERNETATTTMIRVEEGQKVFNAIFKRIYRAIGNELEKIADLNAIYLEPETYFRVLDDNSEGVVTLADFRNDGTDVQPIADPSMANTATKMAKAEFLMAQMGNPLLNKEEITKRALDAADVSDVAALIIPQDQLPPPPPDPAMEKMALEAQKMKNEDINDDKRVIIEASNAETNEYKAKTERFKAKAEAAAKLATAGVASDILVSMVADLENMAAEDIEDQQKDIQEDAKEAQDDQVEDQPQMGQDMPQDMGQPMPPEVAPEAQPIQ